MTRIAVHILLILTPLFCAPALAQSWYLDINGGQTYMDTRLLEQDLVDRGAAIGEGSSTYEIRNLDAGGSLALAVQLAPYWALQAGYMSLGRVRVLYRESESSIYGTVNRNFNDKYATSLVYIAAEGIIPVSERWQAIPRFGVARWRLRYRHYPFCSHDNPVLDLCSAWNSTYSQRRYYGNGLMLGAAARYAWTDTVGIKLGWDFVSNIGLRHKTGEFDGHLFSIGMDHRFSGPQMSQEVPSLFRLDDTYFALGASYNAMTNTEPSAGYQLLAGYRFPLLMPSVNYGLELGYMDTGDMEAKSTGIAQSAAGVWLAGVLAVDVMKDISAIVKVGADSGDDRGALYGAGARYMLTAAYGLELDYMVRDNVHSSQVNLIYSLTSVGR